MLSFEELSAIAPQQVCLSITQSDLNAADAVLRHTQYSNEAARQQAHHNLLSLQLVKQWIANFLDTTELQPWLPDAELPTVWDVVNGTLLHVGKSRLVLIPNGDRPLDELLVPQEWVDHPDWCGDYYLAVDINLEQRWLRIAGYTTYSRLKQSWFDDIDRTYCLPVDALIEDLNIMWVGRELMPNPAPKVPALPPIGSQTAERLIEQLSAVKDYSPRLDVPFGQWSMLVTHSDYRQLMYQHRTTPAIVRLQQWLQGQITSGWNAVQTLAETEFQGAIARGTSSSSQGERLVLDGKVSLIVHIEPLNHVAKDTASSEYRISVRACLSQPLETAQYLSLSCSGGDEDDCEASTPDDSNLELLPLIGEAGEAFEVTLVLGEQQETVQFML